MLILSVGCVVMSGKVVVLLEFGFGFNLEFIGWENVMLYG